MTVWPGPTAGWTLLERDCDEIFLYSKQYLLPAIVHINHQPFLERGDGPIVSIPKWKGILIFGEWDCILQSQLGILIRVHSCIVSPWTKCFPVGVVSQADSLSSDWIILKIAQNMDSCSILGCILEIAITWKLVTFRYLYVFDQCLVAVCQVT